MNRDAVRCLAVLAVSATLVVLSSCGGGADSPATPVATAVPPTPTAPPPGTDLGAVGDGKALRTADGRLEIRGAGKVALDVTVRVATSAPAAPNGWALATPVYEITARDKDRPVTRLADPFELRFTAGAGPLTVMYFDGSAWVLVESDIDGSAVVATTDHLTPYTVARPSNSTSASAATVTPTVRATSAAPAVSRTPGANGTAPALTPAANVTTAAATVSAADAQAALEAVLLKYKGKKLEVSGAAGYSGSAAIAVPPAIQSALDKAVSAGGQLYYGLYTGVNEVITTTAAGGSASGSLSVLVEPKTAFPASAAEASTQLATFFPGSVGQQYQKQVSSATAYTFWSQSGGTTWVLGFVQYQGLPLAFLVVGSGSYATSALVTASAN